MFSRKRSALSFTLITNNECEKQFVLNPEKKISEEKKAIIDKLLLEKISLRSIARSVGVSTVWLQKYVKEKYQEQPEDIHIQIQIQKKPWKIKR
jgi:hypothetical protein